MGALLGEPAAGLLALAALLVWPGVLVVRAPWPFVPFLSLSFWLVTWDWLAPNGPGRSRFLLVALAFFVLVSGLRLFKPWPGSRPSWGTLVVLAAALGRLAPFFLWPVAPGLEAAFSSSSALLLVWRDGLPGTYLPLYPILGFGLLDAGLAALAADVSLLANVPAHRAYLLLTLASESLLGVALFAFARRLWTEAWSAMGAVAVTAVALLGAAWGDGLGGGVPLALALTIAGAGLVLHAHGRSSCVATGVLWAGGASLSASVVLAGGLAALAAIVPRRGWRATACLGLAAAVAGLVAAPVLWRTALAAPPGLQGLLGLTLALLAGAGFAATTRGGPWPEANARVLAAFAILVGGATLADWRLRSARVAVTADEVAAAAWLRDHSQATDVICAEDEAARAWIPALAGRAASPAWWPPSAGAARWGPALPSCRFAWGSRGALAGPAVFTQGRVSLARLQTDAGATAP